MEPIGVIRTMVITESNLPILERFLAAFGEAFEPGRTLRKSFDEVVGSDSAWCLLSLADEEPIGLCVTARVPKPGTRTGFLFVDEIYVAETWRRRGVGTRLIARVEQIAKERSLAGVRLLARPMDVAAHAFYTALGYERSETLLLQRAFEQGADQI